MLSALLAFAALAAAPSPCPANLLVADPRLKVVRAANPEMDNYVVTVAVRNRGPVAQPSGVVHHLELLRHGSVIGSQPIPPLGPKREYLAAFRLQLPHQRKRPPLEVAFRYFVDAKSDAARNSCTPVTHHLSATL
jgi:hypothetical protein